MVERASLNFSLEDFEKLHLVGNSPCIFSKKLTADWRSRQNWVINGKPNLSYIKDNFANCMVPIADCGQKHFNAHQKKEMLLHDFINYWQCLQKSATANEATELLYLKDWHLQREFPEYRAYEVLEFFKSDWLNEFFDVNNEVADDYRFVYMGPQGTWTSFHADVFRSYSWSANICGRKKWILYPPGQEENLKDRFGNLPFDATSDELKDPNVFPNAHKAVSPIEFTQEEGEVVFIPSGWYHQVHNIEDTISINHNWINAYGVHYMFEHLKAELKLVENEIAEYRETEGWRQQCQLILKCSAGMDYEGFLKMLVTLMKPRIELLKRSFKEKAFETQSEQSSETCELLNAFKRVDITCVAGEHVKYGEPPSIKSKTLINSEEFELHATELANRTKRVVFDLVKLAETFRKLYLEANFDRDLSEELRLVSEVEETLENL